MEELCPYCKNNYIKMLDTHEYVCEYCGHVYNSEEWKPGALSELFDK